MEVKSVQISNKYDCLYQNTQELGRGRQRISTRGASWFQRGRRMERPTHRVIDPNEDCFLVTSDEGELFFKSSSDVPVVCGIYMIADPDKRIQVIFNYLDVPCDNGGLVAWVDGWELNGQVWPADAWDDDRVVESCDHRPQRKLVSRQNAALVQYRVPARGKGFAITVRHLKNVKPCNVMLFGSEGVFTLRNHGTTGNCSLIAIAPTAVRVLDLNVGQVVKRNTLLDIETGTLHQCIKRGLPDYVDIGGAAGLDHTKMEVFENICGLDSNEGHIARRTDIRWGEVLEERRPEDEALAGLPPGGMTTSRYHAFPKKKKTFAKVSQRIKTTGARSQESEEDRDGRLIGALARQAASLSAETASQREAGLRSQRLYAIFEIARSRRPVLIACEDTVVRLVSSGRFQNSVTLAFTSLAPEDIEQSDLICGMNEMNELAEI
ncbi:hypothetical protein MSG28_002922 [Choristoneura fumiferana]|uniref:Uncharacterized protein n=1 Tax=Choristoneura fumiferana TaxID=7141 RepID=A0ACC0JJY3_CHOFU|nr:hypothetical protein MSG28_002922 [Choristoneura fumiferana]